MQITVKYQYKAGNSLISLNLAFSVLFECWVICYVSFNESFDSSFIEIDDFSNFSDYKIYSLLESKKTSKSAHINEKIHTNTLVKSGYEILPVKS